MTGTDSALLRGQVAVVTGITSGIGRAVALGLARAGARIVGCARRDDRVSDLACSIEHAGSKLLFTKADASVPGDVRRLLEEALRGYSRIDILISNVGLMTSGTAPETSIADWQRCLDVNLGSPFLLAKYGLPHLYRQGSGAMVLIAGELGLIGASSSVAYCAAKGGLINMTRALAVDSAIHGVRVNCVCPGAVETPLLRDWIASAPDPDALERAQTQPILLSRIAQPEEIADVVVFTASSQSSYVTGSIIVADGGLTAWYGM